MSMALRLLAVLAALQAATGTPAGAQIGNDHIRAAQTGDLPNFKNPPPPDTVAKMIEVDTSTAAGRRRILSGIGVVPQMVGGTPVAGFHDVIKIKFKAGDGVDEFCSGFLFSGDQAIDGVALVLTAAHCTCGHPNSYRFLRDSAVAQESQFFVLAAPPFRYARYSCLIPPENQPGRDLALMRIRDPASIEADGPDPRSSPAVPFIATMHQVYQDTATRRLVGVGYGFTESGAAPSVAFAAIIPIQSFFCSQGFFAASSCASFREFVLADPTAGQGANPPDSCGGDSGAPIFWVPPAPETGATEVKAESFRFLVGITSRALNGVVHNRGTTCGGGGIYTAVGHPDVIDWLSSHGVMVRTKYK